mmetsp:Transcript_21463/g.51670  ORF Transcript_21463/g.51670 Transcript_21463/m.51670 type:complete len:255 (-) Transcript_21463:236-1000(-)
MGYLHGASRRRRATPDKVEFVARARRGRGGAQGRRDAVRVCFPQHEPQPGELVQQVAGVQVEGVDQRGRSGVPRGRRREPRVWPRHEVHLKHNLADAASAEHGARPRVREQPLQQRPLPALDVALEDRELFVPQLRHGGLQRVELPRRGVRKRAVARARPDPRRRPGGVDEVRPAEPPVVEMHSTSSEALGHRGEVRPERWIEAVHLTAEGLGGDRLVETRAVADPSGVDHAPRGWEVVEAYIPPPIPTVADAL